VPEGRRKESQGRKKGQSGTAKGSGTPMELRAGAPVVILVNPQLGENIGMAARAMLNFALTELRLVNPRDGWPSESAQKASSGALNVIEGALVFDTLEEAIADLHYVLAATARERDQLKPVMTAEKAALTLRSEAAGGNKTGILFGAERSGLANEHIALADAILMAPVNPSFASLNLSQAVLLAGYEWFKSADVRPDQRLGEGLHQNTPKATKAELQGLFDHLETELDASGFLRPPEKRRSMVRNMRDMWNRAGLMKQDVRTLRGIVKSLVLFGGGRKPDGDE
jgi:tRNA/rRNA methyltransferase